jgi:hypothetical protein
MKLASPVEKTMTSWEEQIGRWCVYLAVSESGWLSRHGGDVEQDEGMRLVIQFRIGPDDSGDRVNGEVAIRIAGIDGVAGCVGTWA